ncbi:MAG: hypothetical protein ACRDAM_17400, partial [Casimicrobium sp.]
MQTGWMKWIAVFSVCTTLVGCSSFQKQAFNREAASSVKTLSMIVRGDEEAYDLQIVVHPAANFGLIGAIAAEA